MNEVKESILNRLHEKAGVCAFCGWTDCVHGVNTELPTMLLTTDVLWAINLDDRERVQPEQERSDG